MSSPALRAAFRVRVGEDRKAVSVEAELELEAGVLVLFGPSGAGKSLTVQTLAGLLQPETGHIEVGGRVLFDRQRDIDVPAHRRRVGYVPQHHMLFPFCNVAKNVTFGLPRKQRRRMSSRVRELLEELGIAGLAEQRPDSLSGGERRRVALARALVVQPQLLLLDEPFASLDEEARETTKRLLLRTLARHGVPAVLVTHDRLLAHEIGDRLVRYAHGRTLESIDLRPSGDQPGDPVSESMQPPGDDDAEPEGAPLADHG